MAHAVCPAPSVPFIMMNENVHAHNYNYMLTGSKILGGGYAISQTCHQESLRILHFQLMITIVACSNVQQEVVPHEVLLMSRWSHGGCADIIQHVHVQTDHTCVCR